VITAIVAGAAILQALAIAAPAAAQDGVHYVALGDSYSAGLGAGGYYASSGSCDRSADAYPALWARANDPASFAFEACSGATAGSVMATQLSALSDETTLVSITVGGNDVGFADVMAACVIGSTAVCADAVDAAEYEIASVLPVELDKALSAISADAPNAQVVVLGYPDLYDLSQSAYCIGLSSTDRIDLNQAADQLDGQIQAAARRHGDEFADVRPAFAGHQICDPDSWLRAVDWFDLDYSYHPTAQGQADGYYPVFSALAS
jgi:lysophospholipase L1-like esterase